MFSSYSGCFIDDGLGSEGADRFHLRRVELMTKNPGITVISGILSDPTESLGWHHFRPFFFQDPSILYLTGINQCGVILMLDSERHEVDVFLPRKNTDKEFWDGKQFGAHNEEDAAALKGLSGLTRIHSLTDWWTCLLDRLSQSGSRHINTYFHQNRKKRWLKDNHYSFYQTLKRRFKREHLQIEIRNIASSLIEDRIRCDEPSVKHASYANKIADQVFRSVCKQMKTFSKEHHIYGAIEGEVRASSPFGTSFQPIVAAGRNANVLHYTKNDDDVMDGQLVLMDFGIRWHSMVSDISRTIPKNGQFNPLQRVLYTIVLNAQHECLKWLAPGVTIDELNSRCWKYIDTQLHKQIVEKGGTIDRAYKSVPHNVGHLIGIQVHEGDPFRGYRTIPLVANNIITLEPGLYGTFSCQIDGHFYKETCGIRIEDNYLVVPGGSRNLSGDIPKHPSDIEALMRAN